VANRTRSARTRLTPDEYDAYLLRSVEAGFSNPSEYLRSLVVGQDDLQSVLSRIANLERRLEHVESQVAEVWLRESTHEEHPDRSSQ
jgi:hypothetical protein